MARPARRRCASSRAASGACVAIVPVSCRARRRARRRRPRVGARAASAPQSPAKAPIRPSASAAKTRLPSMASSMTATTQRGRSGLAARLHLDAATSTRPLGGHRCGGTHRERARTRCGSAPAAWRHGRGGAGRGRSSRCLPMRPAISPGREPDEMAQDDHAALVLGQRRRVPRAGRATSGRESPTSLRCVVLADLLARGSRAAAQVVDADVVRQRAGSRPRTATWRCSYWAGRSSASRRRAA